MSGDKQQKIDAFAIKMAEYVKSYRDGKKSYRPAPGEKAVPFDEKAFEARLAAIVARFESGNGIVRAARELDQLMDDPVVERTTNFKQKPQPKAKLGVQQFIAEHVEMDEQAEVGTLLAAKLKGLLPKEEKKVKLNKKPTLTPEELQQASDKIQRRRLEKDKSGSPEAPKKTFARPVNNDVQKNLRKIFEPKTEADKKLIEEIGEERYFDLKRKEAQKEAQKEAKKKENSGQEAATPDKKKSALEEIDELLKDVTSGRKSGASSPLAEASGGSESASEEETKEALEALDALGNELKEDKSKKEASATDLESSGVSNDSDAEEPLDEKLVFSVSELTKKHVNSLFSDLEALAQEIARAQNDPAKLAALKEEMEALFDEAEDYLGLKSENVGENDTLARRYFEDKLDKLDTEYGPESNAPQQAAAPVVAKTAQELADAFALQKELIDGLFEDVAALKHDIEQARQEKDEKKLEELKKSFKQLNVSSHLERRKDRAPSDQKPYFEDKITELKKEVQAIAALFNAPAVKSDEEITDELAKETQAIATAIAEEKNPQEQKKLQERFAELRAQAAKHAGNIYAKKLAEEFENAMKALGKTNENIEEARAKKDLDALGELLELKEAQIQAVKHAELKVKEQKDSKAATANPDAAKPAPQGREPEATPQKAAGSKPAPLNKNRSRIGLGDINSNNSPFSPGPSRKNLRNPAPQSEPESVTSPRLMKRATFVELPRSPSVTIRAGIEVKEILAEPFSFEFRWREFCECLEQQADAGVQTKLLNNINGILGGKNFDKELISIGELKTRQADLKKWMEARVNPEQDELKEFLKTLKDQMMGMADNVFTHYEQEMQKYAEVRDGHKQLLKDIFVFLGKLADDKEIKPNALWQRWDQQFSRLGDEDEHRLAYAQVLVDTIEHCMAVEQLLYGVGKTESKFFNAASQFIGEHCAARCPEIRGILENRLEDHHKRGYYDVYLFKKFEEELANDVKKEKEEQKYSAYRQKVFDIITSYKPRASQPVAADGTPQTFENDKELNNEILQSRREKFENWLKNPENLKQFPFDAYKKEAFETWLYSPKGFEESLRMYESLSAENLVKGEALRKLVKNFNYGPQTQSSQQYQDFKLWQGSQDCSDMVTDAYRVEYALRSHMKNEVFEWVMVQYEQQVEDFAAYLKIGFGYVNDVANGEKVLDEITKERKKEWEEALALMNEASRQGTKEVIEDREKFSRLSEKLVRSFQLLYQNGVVDEQTEPYLKKLIEAAVTHSLDRQTFLIARMNNTHNAVVRTMFEQTKDLRGADGNVTAHYRQLLEAYSSQLDQLAGGIARDYFLAPYLASLAARPFQERELPPLDSAENILINKTVSIMRELIERNDKIEHDCFVSIFPSLESRAKMLELLKKNAAAPLRLQDVIKDANGLVNLDGITALARDVLRVTGLGILRKNDSRAPVMGGSVDETQLRLSDPGEILAGNIDRFRRNHLLLTTGLKNAFSREDVETKTAEELRKKAEALLNKAGELRKKKDITEDSRKEAKKLQEKADSLCERAKSREKNQAIQSTAKDFLIQEGNAPLAFFKELFSSLYEADEPKPDFVSNNGDLTTTLAVEFQNSIYAILEKLEARKSFYSDAVRITQSLITATKELPHQQRKDALAVITARVDVLTGKADPRKLTSATVVEAGRRKEESNEYTEYDAKGAIKKSKLEYDVTDFEVTMPKFAFVPKTEEQKSVVMLAAALETILRHNADPKQEKSTSRALETIAQIVRPLLQIAQEAAAQPARPAPKPTLNRDRTNLSLLQDALLKPEYEAPADKVDEDALAEFDEIGEEASARDNDAPVTQPKAANTNDKAPEAKTDTDKAPGVALKAVAQLWQRLFGRDSLPSVLKSALSVRPGVPGLNLKRLPIVEPVKDKSVKVPTPQTAEAAKVEQVAVEWLRKQGRKEYQADPHKMLGSRFKDLTRDSEERRNFKLLVKGSAGGEQLLQDNLSTLLQTEFTATCEEQVKDALDNRKCEFTKAATPRYVGVGMEIVRQEDGLFRVKKVAAGSQAEGKGIKKDDILTKVNGIEITRDTKLEAILAELLTDKLGSQVKLTVRSNDGKLEEKLLERGLIDPKNNCIYNFKNDLPAPAAATSRGASL